MVLVQGAFADEQGALVEGAWWFLVQGNSKIYYIPRLGILNWKPAA